MIHLKPLFGRVLLRRELVEKTSGGVFIPQDSQKFLSSQVAEVIAVGPTCDETIKPGMKVYIGKHAGDWLKLPQNNTQEFYICQDEDVLGIVETMVPTKAQPVKRNAMNEFTGSI